MEKTRCTSQIYNMPTTTLLFLLFLCFQTVECQEPKPQPPSQSYSNPPRFDNGPKRIVVSVFLGALTGFSGAIVFAFMVRFFIRYMNTTPILKGSVVFSPEINRKTLQSALSNETHHLGSSPNGTYYLTPLDNGFTVAVKRLEPTVGCSPETQSKSVKRKIQQELEKLANLNHPNVMILRAYVRETERFYLVYDYVPTGSLEDAMNRVRENQLELSWEVRLRIAVGVIKGLQHLHCSCVPQILHYNLKPRNVILDSEFEPRLTDSGLGLLMPNLDRASSGYSAPECFQDCRYTDKSDIFSFGMILGVLLTGRDPTDPFFGEAVSGGSLGRWLRHLQQAGEAREALDKSILGEQVEEDEMLMAVRIAVVCLSDMPTDRPSSDQLVHMLTQLHSF
ncbi:hypothetical protein HS088_TW06G00549 [Tripterygium wilfordii]|uniref:Protein kinase domain-containing protein n=1 Tax=Tripterygium wilfordii TaxID=458696 RepID=A0A7J7DJ98_TRIWF|nr:inactive leucine-rich repeat receptor-like protein kinase CORYNE [Tripterygium wilfordii]XP_038703439.1 inactive leucine-rich repeat receptor-like protein kinase CORYNE [Tripterygium wilfordii]XP_038703440.1 inactive leucine-rich repeat receptor-like protein kinase CORYNE [Tripterygium wilfordii]KAF5746378.1 hypothetical protein HS088_TW06G00549 [Tripterygium wilfordii]